MNQLARQIMGLTREHLEQYAGGVWLHGKVIEPFNKLREAATAAGLKLTIASGFRDFGRQLAIWNAKASGARAVYSQDGSCQLDISTLTDEALMYAILRWSALPGTSRHHWGTDMDVWDEAAVGPDYQLQLTPDEYSGEGPFAALDEWLRSGVLEQFGFFQPYSGDRGGVSPEAWHISYRPLAQRYSDEFDLGQLAYLIRESDILLKEVIVANLGEIQWRFLEIPRGEGC